MQAPLSWLREYVNIELSPEQLAEKLTMAGVAVEGICYRNKGITKVVTGKITGMEFHQDANRLRICKVDIGSETLQIVTGADNVKVGDVIPVALVGAVLPGDKKIEAATLRGVQSAGMLCSAEELGIDNKLVAPEQREGIYILPSDTPVGKDAVQILGLDDVILEFELTANRADCFSVIGIAREIAALTGAKLKRPMAIVQDKGPKIGDLASVTVEARDLCPRFAARVLQNIKVAPSPLWLQQRLQGAGMRPINNIVDVTNYVMLETGQPMHAYDYNLLSRHSLIVRKAKKGEKITTLDGNKVELTDEMLVIADAVQPVGIAGVMGGLTTEVTRNTQNILLEAAAFHPISVRRTAKALGFRTEASQRFEKGVDTASINKALDRATKLLVDLAGGTVAEGVIDNYSQIALPQQITVDPDEINKLLGTDFAAQEMKDILCSLEFGVEGQEKLKVTVPTWRMDVARSADIAEEVARIAGYNTIETTLPYGNVPGGQSYKQDIEDCLCASLVSCGLNETISLSFTHPRVFDKLNLAINDKQRQTVKILHPITEDFPVLRTTLLASVLETVARNISRNVDDLGIFEMGAVYYPNELPLKELPDEPIKVAGAITGKRYPFSWNQSHENVDFFDLKGIAETVFERIGIDSAQFVVGQHPSLHPGKNASIMINNQYAGYIGELHPTVAEAFDISKSVYVFEMDVSVLVANAKLIPLYQPLPRYPAVTRDLAVIVGEHIQAGNVQQSIQEAGGQLLKNATLFDDFRGGQIPQGSKSLAYALTYQASDRTLTDKDVEEIHKKVVQRLADDFSAKLRM